MTQIEKVQMARYLGELEDDMNHILRKYCRIMGWDIPELDEQDARALILKAMHDALAKVEQSR